MLIKLRKKMAQSTLEYAVLVVVVIAALLSIQNYLKRGIAGKIKSSTDDISSEQYDPARTTYNKVTRTSGGTTDRSTITGSSSEIVGNEVTNTEAYSSTNTEED